MRVVIIAFLLLILASLGSALYFLMADRSGSPRMLRALTVRVGLSVVLFLMLMLAHYFGIITLRSAGPG
jgi:hypothetical protein